MSTLMTSLTDLKAFGPAHLPKGSPWCDGNATDWWVGHDYIERPRCQVGEEEWEEAKKATLSLWNEGGNVDRHGCGVMDVDQDGVVDLICAEGAEGGRGSSFIEVYLTQLDGSLRRVKEETGLETTNGMRMRGAHPIEKFNSSIMLLLITVEGTNSDGTPNHHRIYERLEDPPLHGGTTFFRELAEPAFWDEVPFLPHVFVGDIDGNGAEDVLLCNGFRFKWITIYYQRRSDEAQKKKNSTLFTRLDVPLPESGWIFATMADFSGDGRLDLIGSDGFNVWIYEAKIPKRQGKLATNFLDDKSPPSFNFKKPIGHFGPFPHFSRSFSVFDFNNDGFLDVYAVQADMGTSKEGTPKRNVDSSVCTLPRGECPPNHPCATDSTHANDDLLFVGCGPGRSFIETKVPLDLPGCGYWVNPFGTNEIALSRATHLTPGPKYLLKWPTVSPEPACALRDIGVQVKAGWDTNLVLACVTDANRTTLPGPSETSPQIIAGQCCERNNGTCRRFLQTDDDTGCIAGHALQAEVKAMTWQESANKCHGLGLDLCDESCTGKGCGYNYNPVWTKVPCSLKNNGFKALAGWDTNLTLACVTQPNQTMLKIPAWETPRPIAAQCCETNGTCRRFLQTDDDDGCIAGHGLQAEVRAMTLQEAADKCRSLNLKLCDQSCVSKGCGYNYFAVYTNLPC